ncbi:MAG: FAD-dependent oxidoreductase, partial [Promethearchaeota archaeon]
SEKIDQGLRSAPNLDIYRGIGEFTGKFEMHVKLNSSGEYSNKFKGKRFVLASGGRSIIPPIKGLEQIDYITTKTFFGKKFPTQPWKSLIIIGGGIIAAEFAHIFSAMGSKVTIIEMLPRLVTSEEPKISQVLEEEFRKNMTVLTNAKAVGARNADGMKFIDVEFEKTGNRVEYKAEAVLVATGRRSNADILRVEQTGVQTDERGWIKTDEFLQTNVENIWVIGDANGKFQFRHKANHDAEIAVRNIFGQEKVSVDYSAVPWAIFTYPQIAHVGLTEKEAIDKGYRIYVAEKQYSSIAKGFAMGLPENFFFKMIVNEDYSILGAHIIGPHAATLIQQIVYLMNAGFSCEPGEQAKHMGFLPKELRACPESASFMPIYKSQVIHPSLNEVVGWALSNLQPVNIPMQNHHGHNH